MKDLQIRPDSLLRPLSSDQIILEYSEKLNLLLVSFEDKISIFDFRSRSLAYSFCTPPQIKLKFKILDSEYEEIYFFALSEDGEKIFVKNLSSDRESLFKLDLPPSILPISHFTSFGSTLVLGSLDGSVFLYDFKSGKIIDKLSNSSNSKISLIRIFANYIAIGYDNGSIAVFDKDNRNCLINLKPHSSSIICLFYCPHLSHFYSSSADNSISIFSLGTNANNSFGFKSPIRAFVFLNHTLFAFDNSGDVYSLTSNGFLLFKRINIAIQDVFICNDRVIIFDGSLLLFFTPEFNMEDDTCIALNHFSLVDSCLISSEEHKFLSVSSGSNDLYCYPIVNNSVNYFSRRLSFHRDSIISILKEGSSLITASRDGEIIVWQLPGFSKKLSIFSNQSNVILTSLASCSLNNDQFFISAAFDTGLLNLYKISISSYEYEEIWSIKCHNKEINSVTFVSLIHLATTSLDKLVNIIDTRNGSIVGVLTGHKRGVLSFDSNTKYFASGSSDKNIILWDKNFTRVCNIEGHDFPITRLKFLKNGILLSGDSSGLIKLWDTSSKHKIVGYCDHLTGKVWAIQEFADKVYISDSNGFIIHFPVEFSIGHIPHTSVNSVEEDKLKLFMNQNRFIDALKVSLLNKKPLQAYQILQKIIKDLGWGKSRDLIISFLTDNNLPVEIIDLIIEYSCDWCTHNKRSQVSHLLINSILSSGLPFNGKLLSSLRPYMERHYNKIDEILRQSYSFEMLTNK